MEPNDPGALHGRPVDLLSILSDELCVKILVILYSSPSNPRRLSRVLGADESSISRRLRALERLGLVEARWARVGGANVKIYYARAQEITIKIGPEGLSLAPQTLPGKVAFDLSFRPPSNRVFVGRAAYLEALRRAGPGVLVVMGIAGIGKTSLVAEALKDSPYPVIWINIYAGETLFQLLRSLSISLASLGITDLVDAVDKGALDPGVLIGILIDILRSRGLVVVLDDYHLNSDPGLDSMLSKISRTEGLRSTVIVITRVRPRFYTAHGRILELGEMGFEESVELGQKMGLDRGSAEEAYRLLGGHPHLISIYAKTLGSGGRRSAEAASKDYILGEVLRGLSPGERRILELLCISRRPAPYAMIKGLGPGRELREALKSLEERFLVRRRGGLYVINELVREACSSAVEDPEELHEIAADFYRSRASEDDYVEAAHHYIEARRYDDAVEALSRLLGPAAQGRTPPQVYTDLVERLAAQKTRIKRENRGWVELAAAVADKLRGDFRSCGDHLDIAEEIAVEASSQRLLMLVKMERGIALRHEGLYSESLRELSEALEISRRLRDREAYNRILYNIATINYSIGRIEDAQRALEALLKHYRASGDRFGEALAMGWLGMCYRLSRGAEESLETLRKAIEVFSDVGAVHALSIAYREVASTLHTALKFGDALEALRRSLEILGAGDYPYLLAGIYIDMAINAMLSGNEELGGGMLEKAIEVIRSRSIDDPEYSVLIKLGQALLSYMRGASYREELEWAMRNAGSCSLYRRIQVLGIAAALMRGDISSGEGGENLHTRVLELATGIGGNGVENIEKYLFGLRKAVAYISTKRSSHHI